MKPVAAVDLDGTIAQYDEWKGEESIGEPIEGATKFVHDLNAAGFEVVVFSARASSDAGVAAIWSWLQQNGLGQVVTEVTNIKQYRFAVMIDDRAIQYDGGEFNYVTALTDARDRVGMRALALNVDTQIAGS